MTSKDLYFRLLRYTAPHKSVFALSIVGTIILAATEPALPALLKVLLDGSFVDRDPELIMLMPLALIALIAVRGAAGYTSSVAMDWVATRIVMELRSDMFRKILNLPSQYFDDHPSGAMLSRMSYDVTRVMHAATTVLITLIRDTLIIIGLLAWSLYLNWKLALVAFLVAPPTVLVIRTVSRRLRTLSRQLQEAMGDLTRVSQEAILGNREIRIFGGKEYENKRFYRINNWVRRFQMKVATASEASVPIGQILMATALALVIYVASLQSQAGEITVGGFVSLIGALALLSSPIKRLTKINEHLQAGLAAAESIFALIDEPGEIDTGSRNIGRAHGNIRFERVGFRYPGTGQDVLADISLDIPAGKTIALVGQSGSGKSTLGHLLPRFYSPSTGKIFLDGIDLDEIRLHDLRANIAYVSQDVVLFNDTVAANIGYGALGSAEPEQISEAARQANALEFIEQLPKGMETLIGENGVRLSGGQRQRLAIARALLKDAPILILDEATSALDTESEHRVQQALDNARAGRTSIIIAHRLSTIENADLIVVLQSGRIVERGTHRLLLERNGVYASLHRLQDRDDTASE